MIWLVTSCRHNERHCARPAIVTLAVYIAGSVWGKTCRVLVNCSARATPPVIVKLAQIEIMRLFITSLFTALCVQCFRVDSTDRSADFRLLVPVRMTGLETHGHLFGREGAAPFLYSGARVK
jgi:hypothetical protein